MKCASKWGMRRFATDSRGNFGLLASVVAVPLVMSAGVMVDLSTISRTKQELQAAMDAAVLAVAREGEDLSDKDARAIANTFIGGNLVPAYTNLKVLRDGTAVTLEADTRAAMAFGGLFGYDFWPVKAAASADIAYAAYEISLVLDTTGSMAGGKLTAMKDAVYGLIDDMSDQIKDKDRLKFSLVPFATFVNVGPQFGPAFDEKGKVVKDTGADWLDVHGRSDMPQTELVPGLSRFEVYHHLGQEWKGCVETREPSKKGAHDVADTPAQKNDKASLFVPAFAIDEPDDEDRYRNSYIDSDADPLDKTAKGTLKKLLKYGLVDLVGGGSWNRPDTDYDHGKGPGHGCDTQPITPLTSDYGLLKKRVKALEARGTTNIMEGVAWGMRVLSPHEPFSEGIAEDSGVEKIMIVLTDGSNVFGNRGNKLGSSYSSFGYLVDGRLGIGAGGSSTTTKLMNDKTLAACRNAKSDGVEIYTIRLEEPDVETGSMLKECASSPLHYFDTPSRSQLDEVFERIRDGIVRLRIAS